MQEKGQAVKGREARERGRGGAREGEGERDQAESKGAGRAAPRRVRCPLRSGGGGQNYVIKITLGVE